jgi:class 3 adenylate cyclase/TolB-like protein/tetratricopeptide (TPR) repeat protein
VVRKLVAVVYADMVAYSKLIGADDAGTMLRMRGLRQNIIDREVADHGGHIVQTAGDSMLIMFDSVTQAVSCAISVQRGVRDHQKDEAAPRRIRFRMGVEIGDVIADGTDFHGDGVNIAARLQTVCPPGDICVSRTVRDHVKVRLGLNFRPLGALPLKNIARPIEAFVIEIASDWEAPAAPDDHGKHDAAMVLRGRSDIVVLPSIAGSIEHGSVAVLPFANLGTSSSDDYLGEGIVEDIIAKLASYHELTVISRSSTLGYRDGGVDAATVGRQLGVRYVMNGSVTRGGERLRIMAELSDTEFSRVVWSGRFDGVARNLFDIQDEMTAQIVHHIAPQVHANELRRIRLKRPDSMDAYDLVLQALGMHHLFDRKMFVKERQLLRRAMKLDPGYAMPYALLAEWYSLRFGQGWSASAGTKDAMEADRLAAAAIERDPDNVRALAIYGHNRSFMFRDYDRAMVFFERALNAAPSSAQAWCYSSPTFSYIGDGKAAIERAERGLRLSPRDPLAFWYYSALSLGHLTQGTYAEAAHWSNRAYRENPGYLANMRFLIVSLVATGRIQEAEDFGRRHMALDPLFQVSAFADGYAYRDAERRRWLGEMLLRAGMPP